MIGILKCWLFCMAYFAILILPAVYLCSTPISGDVLAIVWIATCLLSALIAILEHCLR